MAGQTGRTVVNIAVDARVLVIGFHLLMAARTAHKAVVVDVCMAIDTLRPGALVGTAVDRKILSVVVKTRRYPGVFIVAQHAVVRELGSLVIGVGRRVVILLVATDAGVGRAVIIPVVTIDTLVGDGRVSAVELVKIVVIVEARRTPPGLSRVALDAIIPKTEGQVVRIARGVKFAEMAVHTLGRSPLKSGRVTLQATDIHMRTGQRESRVVVVKDDVGLSRRVTGQTGRVLIHIAPDAQVLLVRHRVEVADHTALHRKVARRRVTIDAV